MTALGSGAMTFTKAYKAPYFGDYHGCNTLVIGVKHRLPQGFIYKVVTPTFPEITEAYYYEEIGCDRVIATLTTPNAYGRIPELMHIRTNLDLGLEFEAQCIRSRDAYAIAKESRLEPGVNLQPGDVIQMPLAMETALEAMLQADDMRQGRYLKDVDMESPF